MGGHRSTSKKQHSTDQRSKWRKYIRENVEPVLGRDYSTLKVLSVLIDYMGEGKNWCWPSKETLADKSGYSVATVKRATKKLDDIGIITKKLRYYHDSAEYYWTPEYFEDSSYMSPLKNKKRKKIVKRAQPRSGRGLTDDPLTTVKRTTETEERTQDRKKSGTKKIVKSFSSESTNDRKKEDSSRMSPLEQGCEKHSRLKDGLDVGCGKCNRIDERNRQGF